MPADPRDLLEALRAGIHAMNPAGSNISALNADGALGYKTTLWRIDVLSTIERIITEWAARQPQADLGAGLPRVPTSTRKVEMTFAPAPVTPDRWIPVSERLPPAHADVWCCNRDGSQFQGRACYGLHEPFFTYPRGDGNASNTAPAWIDVTHWMPLPAPPKEVSHA